MRAKKVTFKEAVLFLFDASIIIIFMILNEQITWLFLLAIPIACVAWTVTHEEVFREPREYCTQQCRDGKTLLHRKFFYLFTCEYCFSHYVTIAFLFLTHYTLLLPGWRGYLIAGFSLVWIANAYMSLFGLLRQGIVKEKTEIKVLEKKAEKDGQAEEKIVTIIGK